MTIACMGARVGIFPVAFLLMVVCSCAGGERSLERIEFYEDISGRSEPARIAGLSDEDWREVGRVRLNFGYSRSTYWVRLTPSDSGKERILEIRNPHLDHLELFFYRGDGLVKTLAAGDRLPFGAREIDHRHFVFRVPAGVTRIYLRVSSSGSLVIDTHLSDRDDFESRTREENFLFGAYYGVLTLMSLAYILVAFGFQRVNSVYYVLHVLSYGMFQFTMDGLAFQYLWPSAPRLANQAILLTVPLAVISAVWFTRSFLNTRANTRLMDHLLLMVAGACALTIPFALVEGGYAVLIRVQTALAGLFSLIALVAAFGSASFNRTARFFLVAWSFFLVGIGAYALFVSGVLPGLYFARYGLQIGSMLEMSILSVAILDRIRIYRLQREQARKEAYLHQREHARLQSELNERLEAQVEAKTAELAGALEELQRRDRVIQRELRLASDIQSGILPPERLELKGLRIGSYHHFMTGVGGDFFDVYRISGDRVGVLMADVSGHGIPAALITVMAKISFMNVTRLYSSPLKVVQIVNRVLGRTLSPLSSLSYLTAFFMTLDGQYRVQFTSAAHQPALVYRRSSGQVDSWEAPGSVLGCLPDDEAHFSEHEDLLHPGDRVLLYTDGLIESRDVTDAEFGLERLKQLLRDTADVEPDRACRNIADTFDDFSRDVEPQDDVTFMIVEADPDCRGDLRYFGEGQDA